MAYLETEFESLGEWESESEAQKGCRFESHQARLRSNHGLPLAPRVVSVKRNWRRR